MSEALKDWCSLAHMVISAAGLVSLLLLVIVLGSEHVRWRNAQVRKRTLMGPPRRGRHTGR